jgi:hypothetical protein
LRRPGFTVDHVVTAEEVSHERIHTDRFEIRQGGPGLFDRQRRGPSDRVIAGDDEDVGLERRNRAAREHGARCDEEFR